MQETQEMGVWSLGWKDLLEKGTATHSSILAWKIPWTKEPGRLQSMESQRVGHDWAHPHAPQECTLDLSETISFRLPLRVYHVIIALSKKSLSLTPFRNLKLHVSHRLVGETDGWTAGLFDRLEWGTQQRGNAQPRWGSGRPDTQSLWCFCFYLFIFFKEEVARVWREHPEAKCSYMKSLGLHNLSSQEWHVGREGRGVVAGMKAGGVEGHGARAPGPLYSRDGLWDKARKLLLLALFSWVSPGQRLFVVAKQDF